MGLHRNPLSIIFLIMGFAGILLAACSGERAITNTPSLTKTVPTLTASPTIVKPTLTQIPSRTASPSSTAIHVHSPTPLPTRTARLSWTPKPSESPPPTMSFDEIATQNAEGTEELATQNAKGTMAATWEARYATEEAIFPGCGSTNHIFSPDGNWVVAMCMDLDSTTGVYNLNDPSQAWRLQYSKIFGIDVYVAHHIYPWRWTADGRYLYLNVYPCCVEKPCSVYISGEALIRLDLLTGKVAQTVPLDNDGRLYEYSLSSDNTYVAYLRPWLKHPILNLENLVTGKELHIPLGDQYSQAGDVIWSPDYMHIVFSAFNGDGCENTTYYLVMMDLDDSEQTVLLENASEEYFPTEWTDDNHIILYLINDDGYESLNLAIGEIAPYLTPTPVK